MIETWGERQNNLKEIDLNIPLGFCWEFSIEKPVISSSKAITAGRVIALGTSSENAKALSYFLKSSGLDEAASVSEKDGFGLLKRSALPGAGS